MVLRDLSKSADLHVHTTFSDGVFTPGEVVDRALAMGLGAVAITDHDCVEGVAPALEAASGRDITVVPGVEISAAARDQEIHILGYFIDCEDTDLRASLDKMKENRVERVKSILELLRKEGLDLDENKVFRDVVDGTIGRMHLARMMVEAGFVANHYEAFDKFLGNGKPCCLKHVRLDFTRAIEMIKSAGGVPVIAHPGTMGSDDLFEDYVKAGLSGIEVFHVKHKSRETKKYLELALKYGLIVTGGSDCHGMAGGRILMGKATVGIETVDILREEAVKIRRRRSNETQ